ncbi:hypothetical protein Esti_002779 [Eimeria stiedai]
MQLKTVQNLEISFNGGSKNEKPLAPLPRRARCRRRARRQWQPNSSELHKLGGTGSPKCQVEMLKMKESSALRSKQRQKDRAQLRGRGLRVLPALAGVTRRRSRTARAPVTVDGETNSFCTRHNFKGLLVSFSGANGDDDEGRQQQPPQQSFLLLPKLD